MLDFDNVSDFLFDNLKKVFFPEEWLNFDLKFSKSEIFALFIIDKRKEITMTELAEYIHSPMSTATGIIDRLVKNGYIKRERSEADRRIVVLHLGDKGNKVVSELKELISGYISIFADELTSEEKQLLTKIMFKVIKQLDVKFNENRQNDLNPEAINKIEID
jgi:MarR family transcriptional regulator, organic hydroperoxide resistance regulator